ncbi:hypothetical protein DRQ33_05870 [bacterium]|nr:MAG: hypothetical protein DRQ33_05870 [bacterium]
MSSPKTLTPEQEKMVSDERSSRTEQETRKNIGLCETCIHKNECIYYQRSTEPILFCEMFEIYSIPSEHPVSSEIVGEYEQEVEAGENLQGLCKYCEHRFTCTFPKSKTGVWHCQDYE